jgi:hypothetical protein
MGIGPIYFQFTIKDHGLNRDLKNILWHLEHFFKKPLFWAIVDHNHCSN